MALTRVDQNMTSMIPTTVSINGSNQFAIDFAKNINFKIAPTGAWTIVPTVGSEQVGQTGTIIIENGGTTTPGALPSQFKTPNGDNIVFQTNNGDVSILSYLVVSTTIVLVNYVGNFS